MATYKRVSYSVVLPVANGRDYPYEGLNPLLYQAGYSGSLGEPLSGITTDGLTSLVSSVSNHEQAANGLSGLRCGIDAHGGLPINPQATVAYSISFLGSGGTGPYTYALHSGAFPSGLTLTGNVLSGTPDTAGPVSFNLRVTDAHGYFYNEDFTMSVDAGP